MSLLLNSFPKQNGVFLLTPIESDFEKGYLSLRRKENRVYDDQLVQVLPFVPEGHLYHKEWALRQQTFIQIKNYCEHKHSTLPVLELGSGNGWFTYHLSQWHTGEVIGIDMNQYELEQAARVFSKENLHFGYGNIFLANLPKAYFGTIFLNSVIQYFNPLEELLNRLISLLAPNGSIHILDSPIYQTDAINAAKQRSQQYFQDMDQPEMANHYFHHSWKTFENYPFLKHYPKNQIWNRLKAKLVGPANPFPWIEIVRK